MESNPSATIVVIDDSKTAIKLVELALKNCNVQILSYASAIEAERYLKSNQPDLIVLDIVMPEKDGLTFLEEIRSQNHRETSVIMFTSKDYHQDRKTSEKLGAIDFIVKPILVEELQKRILSACVQIQCTPLS